MLFMASALSHVSVRYGGATLGQTSGDKDSVTRIQPCDQRLRTFRSKSSLQFIDTSMTDHPPRFAIAVVDDDQRILESLGSLLESADYAARLFLSAASLLESGCLVEIDCLISDIDMPVMDGFELLRMAHAARPELPIILITGHPDMLNRLPQIGSCHYRLFKKPFDGQELLMAVSDALSNRQLRIPKP